MACALLLLIQRPQRFAELLRIRKGPVDRRKAYVRNLISLLEMPHDNLSNGFGGHFLLTNKLDITLNEVYEAFEIICGHRPLLQRLHEAFLKFCAIVDLTMTILLHNGEIQNLNLFICREAESAAETLSAPTDDEAI